MNIVTPERTGGSVVGPVVGVIVAVAVVAILVILTIIFIRYCTEHSLVKSIQCMNRVPGMSVLPQVEEERSQWVCEDKVQAAVSTPEAEEGGGGGE